MAHFNMIFLNLPIAPSQHKISSVARGNGGAAAPQIIAKDEFCDSSKSVEKLKGGGGDLHFSPKLVAE